MTGQEDDRQAWPFDVRDGRAMVSLGALSGRRFCTYRCPFCYVHGAFASYASMPVAEIVSWLETVSEPYDIVYISGDTDSFAPPRTADALGLLEALAQLKVDLLFTTRFVFSEDHLTQISHAQSILQSSGNLLIGCTSVAQMSVPHLEPPPIQPPLSRVHQLGRLRELGVIPVLAMRPFLPVVADSDYITILQAAANEGVEFILGGAWFADADGVLERGVFRGPTPPEIEFGRGEMDFDRNTELWKVYQPIQTEQLVREECGRLGLLYFNRSRAAVEAIRQGVGRPHGQE